MRGLIVVLALASCGAIGPSDVYGTRVTMSPMLGIAPLVVQVRAVIDRPAPEWYCPDVVIEWSDGTHSTRGADCDPLGVGEVPERWSMWPIWRRLGPGRHQVLVTLRQGARVRQFDLWAEVSG